MSMIKTCIVCGKEFTPINSRQICCSPECSHRHYRKKENALRALKCEGRTREVKCAVCGKVFVTNHSRCRTCSPECSKELERRNAQKRRADGMYEHRSTVSDLGKMSLANMSPVRRRIELRRRANKEYYATLGEPVK